jgi:hypothetical protein
MSRRSDRRRARGEHEEYEAPRGRGIRQLTGLLAVAFVVALGVVVGTRMSSDAIAVLVGVVAGVAASIPCALLLLAVTRRQQSARQETCSLDSDPYADRQSNRHGGHAPCASPPVIIVTPGNAVPQQIAPWSTTSGQAGGMVFPHAYDGAQPGGRREFRVMGYEEPETQADWEA